MLGFQAELRPVEAMALPTVVSSSVLVLLTNYRTFFLIFLTRNGAGSRDQGLGHVEINKRYYTQYMQRGVSL